LVLPASHLHPEAQALMSDESQGMTLGVCKQEPKYVQGAAMASMQHTQHCPASRCFIPCL